jgi:exodeoxyribonuclease V alpha subunit
MTINLKELLAQKGVKNKLLASIPVKKTCFLPIEHIHFQYSISEQELLLAIPELPTPATKKESFSLSVILNDRQELAAEYAENKKSFVLTGAAGTGKTTALRETAKRLLSQSALSTHNFKSGEGPSIAFCAYTHVAVGNMRKALFKDPELAKMLEHNVLTIHALLEFEPEFYDIEDADGNLKSTMRFIPKRTAMNPLHLTHLIIEEASMVDANNLWMKLFDALLPGCQIIFVGDINQLQPIFGASVINYALINLPVVELTEVYRQALDSKIIYNAHRVLKGEDIEPDGVDVKLLSMPKGGKLLSEHAVAILLKNTLYKQWKAGIYDPNLDIVLSPFNKNDLGTLNLNKHIAQFFSDHHDKEVWEIFAGMNRWYLAIGDKILVNKQDGIIKSIRYNARYFGKMPRPPNTMMSRHGQIIPKDSNNGANPDSDDSFELDYSNINVEDISEKEKKNDASHIVTCELESGEEVVLSQTGDFNPQVFTLGYALTVHKAQGREWRRVFFVIHKNQATILHRELVYTAITRASQEVIIVDLTNQINKAIRSQRVKGNDIKEKIEWFNSKVSLEVPVPLIP